MANTTLILDLGNSSTKVVMIHEGQKRVEKMFELNNAFAKLPAKYSVSGDYKASKSSILHMNTEVDHGAVKTALKGYYCNGELQIRELPESVIRPSAKICKWELQSTPLSLHLVFLRCIMALMEELHVTDPAELNLTWKIVTLLPPGDFLNGKDSYINLIRNITKIDAFMPKLAVDINIESIKVFPEGFGAYVSVVYKNSTSLREGFEHLTTSSVLVVDIGGGTTDIIVIKDNKVIQDSKFTIDIGGNNVLQLVRNELQASGFDYDTEDLKQAIIKGYIMDGTKKMNILPLLNKARKEISSRIVAQFNNYLEGTSIKMRTIGYVLFCGGGSIKEEGSDSLIDDIIENIQGLAPNSEIVDIPNMELCGEQISSAMMNLAGATILSELV